LIGPHAGYCYTGPTLAWSYQYIIPKDDITVFLLGPCHHVFLKVCGVSQLDEYETPLGNIELNKDVVNELLTHKEFIATDVDAEEEEFSLEVHLPFIKKVFKGYTSFIIL